MPAVDTTRGANAPPAPVTTAFRSGFSTLPADTARMPANPLSSANLRFSIRRTEKSANTSCPETRPLGLCGAREVARPVRADYLYCNARQIAVAPDGSDVPLIESMGKQWATKGKSDGDEGEEEDWGWEESYRPHPRAGL